MGNMIGVISKADWGKAPKGATHRALEDSGVINKWLMNTEDGICYWGGDSWILYTFHHCGLQHLSKSVSKEEDLKMSIKVVKSVDDLEIGMFIKAPNSEVRVVTLLKTGEVFTALIDYDSCFAIWRSDEFSSICASWSYTYDGEYTPIVKETEAEAKIKELEATIALAQKQLEEYKVMK